MKKKRLLIISINGGLILVVAVLAWVFGPSLWVEAEYKGMVKQQEAGQPVKGFESLMFSMTGFDILLEGEELIAPLSSDFGLVIPKIFANVKVTENVNPAEAQIYQEVLRQAGGVAHAAGTAVPGEQGTVYIFGHSTDADFNVERFNAVFYLLRKLEQGDLIMAYYKGKPYNYYVSEKKVVDPNDINDIVDISDEQRLVLQTCWPPGTTWKRLLIIAKRAEV